VPRIDIFTHLNERATQPGVAMRPLRILTWHVHGSYLYYLAQARQEFYVPVKPDRPEGYVGLPTGRDWPDNLHEVPAEAVRAQEFDCILFQSRRNYFDDQYEILTEEQQRLPGIYLEHDPPREHPTDTRHPVDDPAALLIHVTHFNDLMWDNGRTPTRVIEHGVVVPDHVRYTGELARGLVVVNNLRKRGRRLGEDVFDRVRSQVPLDLVGMGWEQAGGLGEVQHHRLPEFEARYRFFFNPIRYTSLGLAVCEAMMLGMPIVGLATTEMVTVIRDGVSGVLDTDVNRLVGRMRDLLDDPAEAHRLGAAARQTAVERFSIERFARDWDAAFALVAGRSTVSPVASPQRNGRDAQHPLEQIGGAL
jgi:glycosyltransferase involved in cell wall biosynthesis